jgi:lysophospholipase L1-like esterase
MLPILIIGSTILGFAAAFLFYFNYIANFHRIQVFGKGRKASPDSGYLQAFDLPDFFIGKDDLRLLRMVKLRKLPVAVCLGDSITHGIISVNYVARLQEEFQGQAVFVNAGVNGNLAFNLRSRLREDCLEYEPDFVSLLIGTNDVNSRSGGRILKNYLRFQRLPRVPDKAFFLENLRGIFRDLKDCTRARVAVLSLPVIGEDLDSAANRLAREYSADIKALASEFGFSYLGLNEAQNDFLSAGGAKRRPKPLRRILLLRILLMLRRSFDRIAEIHGRRLTYDGLHETTLGAKMIADLISGWLRGVMP